MNESLLTKEELAVRTTLSASQIDTLRRVGKIPTVKGFKRPFKYNLKAVNEAIRNLGNSDAK
jgi:hypothetical protein